MEKQDEIFGADFLRRGEDLRGLVLALLKGGLTKPARDGIGIAAARYVARTLKPMLAKSDPIVLGGEQNIALNNLRTNGYAIIADIFDGAEIEDILAFIEGKKVTFNVGGYDGTTGTGEALVDDLPPQTRFAYYKPQDVRACPAVYRAVHDKNLIALIHEYLRAPPTISSITIWWSYPVDAPIGGMQMYHHDRGDFRSCNLFVYLTDVTEQTGPHAFVEQTHEMETLVPLVTQSLGANNALHKAFWAWMEQHRKTDEDILRFFAPERIKCFTGKRGTSFLEDTRGLHKGTVPTAGPRLAFEIVYTTLPKYNETITPIDRAQISMPPGLETDAGKLHPLVRYATRLMYQ